MAVQFKDYYEILGVSRDASKDDIQRALPEASPQISSGLEQEGRLRG